MLGLLKSIAILTVWLAIQGPALAQGSVSRQWLRGAIVGTQDHVSRNYVLWLPEGTPEMVLYYFSGYNQGLSECDDLPVMMFEKLLVSTHVLPPFAMACVDLGSGFGLDDPGQGEKQESFLISDYIPTIERFLSGVEPGKLRRVAMGNSMGGYVALNMAAKHPGLFSAVSARQPMLFESAPWLDPSVDLKSQVAKMNKWQSVALSGFDQLKKLLPDQKTFSQNNPVMTLAKTSATPPKLFVDVGIKDQFEFYRGITALAKNAKGKNDRFYIRDDEDHDSGLVEKGYLDALVSLRAQDSTQSMSPLGQLIAAISENAGGLYSLISNFDKGDQWSGANALIRELPLGQTFLNGTDLDAIREVLASQHVSLPFDLTNITAVSLEKTSDAVDVDIYMKKSAKVENATGACKRASTLEPCGFYFGRRIHLKGIVRPSLQIKRISGVGVILAAPWPVERVQVRELTAQDSGLVVTLRKWLIPFRQRI